MRTRRRFQPTIELMPFRLVPSVVGSAPDPMDPAMNPSSPPPVYVDPMDPATPPCDPADPNPTLDDGSFLPVTADPGMLC